MLKDVEYRQDNIVLLDNTMYYKHQLFEMDNGGVFLFYENKVGLTGYGVVTEGPFVTTFDSARVPDYGYQIDYHPFPVPLHLTAIFQSGRLDKTNHRPTCYYGLYTFQEKYNGHDTGLFIHEGMKQPGDRIQERPRW